MSIVSRLRQLLDEAIRALDNDTLRRAALEELTAGGRPYRERPRSTHLDGPDAGGPG